jgi:Ca2+-binding RTX toxin-like protein
LNGSFYGGDTLIGGSGNDSIFGGYGTGLFKLEGGGIDTVYGDNSRFFDNHPYENLQTLSVTDKASTDFGLSVDGEDDLILQFSSGDEIIIKYGLEANNQFDQYIFSDKTLTLAQLISAHNSFVLRSGNDGVNFSALPVGVAVAAGAGDDTIRGAQAGGNTLDGGSGHNELYGGGGSDTFVLSSLSGWDSIGDFNLADQLRIKQSTVPVGDGDTTLDGAVTRAAPGGFATSAELVIFTSNMKGAITAASAAAHIGHATSAYAVGQTALFVVDNGTDSAVYYFKSAGNDAVVSASELTLLASLEGAAQTGVSNYLFGA